MSRGETAEMLCHACRNTVSRLRNAASRGTEENQYYRFGEPSQKSVIPRPSIAKSRTAADEEERLGMTRDCRAA